MEKKKPESYSKEFKTFWDAYPGPRRTKKAYTYALWQTKVAKYVHVNEVLRILKRYSCTWDWTKNNGEYIPAPAVFINQKYFLDDPNEISSGQYLFAHTIRNTNGKTPRQVYLERLGKDRGSGEDREDTQDKEEWF